jgi:glycosyltransferase involved in cell wall biosynthesis
MTTSRLSLEKGIDVLLRAWAEVAALHPNLRLIIIGDGPLESSLKGLCKDLRLADSVEFVGSIPNVDEQLINADIFVLPSRAEGLSNALLEAMSHGIPSIATDVGGSLDLIAEDNHEKITQGGFMVARNGLLVNPDDAKGLCKAILYLIQNRGVRAEIGKEGRLHIEKYYSIDLITDKYIKLYQNILDRKS